MTLEMTTQQCQCSHCKVYDFAIHVAGYESRLIQTYWQSGKHIKQFMDTYNYCNKNNIPMEYLVFDGCFGASFESKDLDSIAYLKNVRLVKELNSQKVLIKFDSSLPEVQSPNAIINTFDSGICIRNATKNQLEELVARTSHHAGFYPDNNTYNATEINGKSVLVCYADSESG